MMVDFAKSEARECMPCAPDSPPRSPATVIPPSIRLSRTTASKNSHISAPLTFLIHFPLRKRHTARNAFTIWSQCRHM